LVEAEKARVLGQLEAIEWYEKAIAGAKENEYLNEEALANELACQFYLQKDIPKIAQVYLRDAHYAYQQWGATAKVQQLEAKYPQFLSPKTSNTISTNSTILANKIAPISTTGSSQWLDLNSVTKASQTLSKEIILSKLLEKMMSIVIENAGAEKGYLLLPKQDNWFIEGSGHGSEITVLQSLPIEESEQLSVNIIHYVARTKENIVLNDATQEGNFTRDPYIVKQHSQSILCMPLLNQGQLISILYLENNLTTGAFTSNRIETLNLLSSQLAISIENSLLYDNLEHKVAERTQELSSALDHLKTTQAQLVESEKMASLGGLVAGVAHEINTPIGIGVTAASTLADRTTETVTLYTNKQLKGSALTAYFNMAQTSSNLILNNLNRAAELIQSFKQVAVDQSNLDKRSFVVKKYIEDGLLNLKPHLKKTQHQITVNGDEKIEINSYPGAFSQIVTNLVMNSLNHAYQVEEAGNILFELKLVSERLIIEYSDDGCGISPENLDKIFEPFFTTARMEGGTGLGLHIVFNLVSQKLNGTINVQSEVGVGTKFILNLPLS
ncbi:MAG: GAF domain-containing sensor histidine kinase, partial [Proteobacteria bacterium]|nr:GAF domain-containing sensor histidine kinase [Pseudomonadota bacterium]